MPRLFGYGPRRRRGTFKRSRRFGGRSYRANRQSVVIPRTRAEIKQLVTAPDSLVNPGITGTIFPVEYPARGTNIYNREGNVIKMLDHTFTFSLDGSGSSPTAMAALSYRIILFEWYQALVTPSVGSIIASSGMPAMVAPYNQENAKNFRVLRDRTYKVVGEPMGNQDMYKFPVKFMKWVIPRNEIISFNGAAGLDGNKALFIIVVAQQNTAFTNQISWSESTRWVDM